MKSQSYCGASATYYNACAACQDVAFESWQRASCPRVYLGTRCETCIMENKYLLSNPKKIEWLSFLLLKTTWLTLSSNLELNTFCLWFFTFRSGGFFFLLHNADFMAVIPKIYNVVFLFWVLDRLFCFSFYK